MPDFNPYLSRLLIGVFGVLFVGSVVRIVALRGSDPDFAAKRMGSLKVWWTLAVMLAVAALFGRPGAAVMLAIAGLMGLKEYLNLLGRSEIGRAAELIAFASVFVQYLLISLHRDEAARTLLPIVGLLSICTLRLLRGDARDFIRLTAGVYWGVMILVYALSHAVLLISVDTLQVPSVGTVGPFLFVVIITEMDDIAQALVGRRIGRHKMTMRISPNKTWEGFAGGAITSVALSLLLSPWLTTFPSADTVRGLLTAVGAGLLIVTAALLGDLNMSAIKRDVGVKDGSALLPGMGGIIDRIDSLTFTAPAFYYFIRWMN